MSSCGTALRCPPCTRHRASLLIQHQRLQNSKENVQPSIAVNHRYLRTSELVSRLQNVHHVNRLVSKQCKRLMMKLQEDCQQRGVYVDDATCEGLMEIVKQGGDQVLPPKSFQELFWKQQKEASDRSDLKGMRWHQVERGRIVCYNNTM